VSLLCVQSLSWQKVFFMEKWCKTMAFIAPPQQIIQPNSVCRPEQRTIHVQKFKDFFTQWRAIYVFHFGGLRCS
jgi:hypothetical protein